MQLVLDPDEIAGYVDYRLWFTNPVISSFFGGLSEDYAKSTGEQRGYISRDAQLIVTSYAFLVYYLYPAKPELKQTIEASKELSSNFANVKSWLDKNDAKKAADYFVASMKTQSVAASLRTR